MMTSDLMEKECQLSLEAPQSRWTEEELAAPSLEDSQTHRPRVAQKSTEVSVQTQTEFPFVHVLLLLCSESGARRAQHDKTLPEGFLDKRFNNRLIDNQKHKR